VERRRRDWLLTTAYAVGGVGAALALWPFIAAMQPAEDTIARRTIFDTKNLTGIAPSLINVDQTPVMIFRRTPQELIGLRTQDAKRRDPNSTQSRQPEWAQNWHRSLRPDIMVCVGACTRGDCNVVRISADSDEILCPCCASHYDLAGRVTTGPAPANLRVPAHRFISETEIEFAGLSAP
jgi:ubiquinol-cytochrome c reductase iron-sulfur subunit